MKVWAGWLGLAMALSVALAGCSSNNTTAVTLSISPTTSTVLLGTSIQFVPAEVGSENGIQWSVDGINNGNATVGTIDSTGLYTAPETLPVPPSGIVVPVLYVEPNAGIAGSGSAGSIIELQGGFDFTNFAVGNTITIIGNSVAGWDTSFVIVASGPLGNGNFGVQIATPAGPPLVGTGGSATVTPGVTIGAQVEETSVVATATVTLDSGIRVSLSQTSFTIGTNEQYLFSSANAFGPTVIVTGTSNQAVAWSVTSGSGTIDPNSGLYTAPSTPGTATVTVTSLADNTQFASATVNIVTAVDPTVTSMSPPNGALGAAFQEVFITGTNFISTTNVFVNGALLPSGALFATTSTTLFVIVPDSVLSNFPVSGSTVPLTFTVGRQSGAQQSCSPLPCQLVLSPVRPALVASKPDSVEASASSTAITLDGGYFGTTNTTLGFQGNPMVNVQFAGQGTSFSFNSDRELLVTATPGAVSVPGLYPITVTSAVSGSANGSMAAANLAVQPVSTPSQIASPTVGTSPSAVAINTATGVAVVANQGSNDITLVSLPDGPIAAGGILTQSLCTGALGSGSASSPGCVASAPVSVAVDNVRNLALVANSAVANPTLAVVNLAVSPPQVTALLTFPSADIAGNPFALIPRAVGINPVSGRALVAFTSSAVTGSNAGAILDMNQVQTISGSVTMPAAGVNPVLINVANISNGLNARIAVSPRLNWALATPGGVGALSIVDLGRQTLNQISGIGCVAGSSPPTVTVVTTAVNSLQVGQPVLIAGVSPASFNGIFSVTAANNTSFQYYSQTACPSGASSGSGGTASYANPVASVGVDLNVRAVSINDETEKALLVDPTSAEPAFIFNILDQSSTPVNNLPTSTSNITGAINPLTNGALILNKGGQAYAVDPTVPTVTCPSLPCPSPPSATFSTGTTPVDVAIDPVTDTAVIVNQGGTVSLYSLGALRSAPQIVQTSVAAAGSPTSSQVTLNSSLGSPATASAQTVTLIGHFDGSSVPQLDGDPSPFTGHTVSLNGRVMTATLSGAALAANGPRRYAVQAADSTTITSNAARLPVIQAVSLITGDCSAPAPQGVAINSGVTSLGQIYSAAIVTEPGCNDVSMVSLSDSSGFTHGTGFGPSPELAVQSNPQGVDVYSPAGLAVVANAGSSSVSIVDMVNDDVPVSFNTDPVPDGVAIDLGTGNALVTANGASVVDTFAVSTTAQTPSNIGVQQAPSGVAIDPLRGVAVAANSASGSNDASILNLSSNTTTFTTTAGSIIFPQGVAFDPISDTFMITSGSNNQVVLLNPVTDQSAAIRVGIDPSSIAYNAVSGTLVTANNLSSTVTMVDFLDQTVRAVFSLNSSSQFAVAIQPQTNLAVIADSADNQLLLVPLPN
jgi:hypothetical protein